QALWVARNCWRLSLRAWLSEQKAMAPAAILRLASAQAEWLGSSTDLARASLVRWLGSSGVQPASRAANRSRARGGWGSMFRSLQGVEKCQQRFALPGIVVENAKLRGVGFAAMPEHRFQQVAGAAVVQEVAVATDGFAQADAPQRRGAP